MPISLGCLGIIDFSEALFEYIADRRGKFAAGMDLAVGQQGYEVKGRTATIARTAWEKFLPLFTDIVFNQLLAEKFLLNCIFLSFNSFLDIDFFGFAELVKKFLKPK